MKKRILKAEDFPDESNIGRVYATSLQDVIYEFIKKHPKCTRRDIYKLHHNEGHVRRSITLMLKSNKVKETFSIQ